MTAWVASVCVRFLLSVPIMQTWVLKSSFCFVSMPQTLCWLKITVFKTNEWILFSCLAFEMDNWTLCFSANPAATFLAYLLTLTCHHHPGGDLSNRSFNKTLEADLHSGRRPDKLRLLGWTNQISLFLPLGGLFFFRWEPLTESQLGLQWKAFTLVMPLWFWISVVGRYVKRVLLRMQVRSETKLTSGVVEG